MSLFLLPLVAFLATPSVSQTVTITRDIPFNSHDCIRGCLYQPGIISFDLGDELECGDPYEEECYCPTAAPRAEIASRYIDDCATESCAAGDLSRDVASMRSYYAAYCIDNGYTAEIVEEWYSSFEEARSTETTAEAAMTSEAATETTETTEEETTTTERTSSETDTAVSSTEDSQPLETESTASSTEDSQPSETKTEDATETDTNDTDDADDSDNDTDTVVDKDDGGGDGDKDGDGSGTGSAMAKLQPLLAMFTAGLVCLLIMG